MIESLLAVAVLLGVVAVGMLAVLLRRQVTVDVSAVLARLETLEKLQDRGERAVKDEVGRSRGESAEQAKALREELHGCLERLIESNHKKAEELRAIVDARLKEIQADNGAKLEEMR